MNPLQELRDVDAPGTELTAEGLVRIGRAGVRRRRNAIAGGAAALVLVVTIGAAALAGVRSPVPDDRPAHPGRTPSASAPSCRAEALPMPGNGETLAPVVDPTGHWAAARLADGPGVAIWHDSELVAVRRDIAVTALAGITANGTVALDGATQGAMIITTGFDQIMTRPTGLAGDVRSEGSAVNAGRDVAGTATFDGGRRAVLWRFRDPGRPVLLATPAQHGSVALALGADGTAGGYVTDNKTVFQPYLWRPDGTAVALRLPGGDTNGSVDAIVGRWAVDFGNGVRWPLDGAADPEPQRFDRGAGRVRAIAADGTVAGGNGTSPYLAGPRGDVRLPALEGFGYYTVGGLSEDARVVAGTAMPHGGPGGGTPLRWICGE
ncbi:hypothetical protein ACPPVO_19780 [Dactylosporangium sp. McL0621]|uniref:hypothetical protein n=1 Tax=Dactylosporangium sp. McL0621 TaxID=3415678 RepID=UPI003CE67599